MIPVVLLFFMFTKYRYAFLITAICLSFPHRLYYIITHVFFYYLPITFCSYSVKVKKVDMLHYQLDFLFVSYYVIICVWHIFMCLWVHPCKFGPEESIWYPVHHFPSDSPENLKLWTWIHAVSLRLEKPTSPTSAPPTTLALQVHMTTPMFFYVSVGIWTWVLMLTKKTTLTFWAISPASYHQLMFLSLKNVHNFYTSPLCSNSILPS